MNKCSYILLFFSENFFIDQSNFVETKEGSASRHKGEKDSFSIYKIEIVYFSPDVCNVFLLGTVVKA